MEKFAGRRLTQSGLLDAFHQRLRERLCESLPTRSTREAEAFAQLDTSNMLIQFLNWQSRLVHPHRRRVLKADGFHLGKLATQHEEAVRHLGAKLAAGVDVTDHLSRRIRHGYVARVRTSKPSADLDMLLNDWGIHHLHLTAQHTRELLFAIFRPGFAYLIAVETHGAWADRALVESAIRTWPEANLFRAVNGILAGKEPTSSEREQLRNAGVTSLVTVDGTTYFPTDRKSVV